MNRDDAIALLRQHRPELRRRYGVLRLALFGSLAREQAQPARDADIWSRLTVLRIRDATSVFSSTWKTCSVARSTW